jgi:catechol 2,3-dioxygenase-like lactoylglutathione lyase family enzyme
MKEGNAMKVKLEGLAHLGLPCRDYKKSVAFYKTIGFEPAEGYTETSGMYGFNGFTIELYQRDDDCELIETGIINHIAFKSSDIDASYEEVLALGYTIVSEGIESNEMFLPKSNRYFIFLGPDNERIEFAQVK